MLRPVMPGAKEVPSAFEAELTEPMHRRAFVLSTAAALSGCAFKSSPFSSYQPLLFSVRAPAGWAQGRDSGMPAGEAWLFGSIHLGLSRFYPLPDEVEKAWAGTDSLAVELAIDARNKSLQQAFSTRVLLPPGETIENHLAAPEVTQIRRLMQFDHMEWQGMRRLQPWALALNLYNPIETQAGPTTPFGVDLYFLKRARDNRRSIFELETPKDQVEAFSGGSMQEQIEQLRNRIAQLSRYERTTELIIEAWRRGDALTLAQLKRDSFGDEHRMASLNQRMHIDRDRKMAEALAKLISEGRKVFCVVGAFHLVGPDSLVERLRRDQGLDVALSAA